MLEREQDGGSVRERERGRVCVCVCVCVCEREYLSACERHGENERVTDGETTIARADEPNRRSSNDILY